MKQEIIFLSVILALFGEVSSAIAQFPGNVSGGLRWWLKSNEGIYENAAADNPAEDGDGVYVWDDQSAINNNATQATSGNRPVYRNDAANLINGYPVLRFSGNQFIDGTADPGIGNTESFNIFLVFKQTTWTNGGTNDGNGSFIIDRPPPESNNLISFKMVSTDKYFYQRRDNAGNNLGGPTSATSANTTSFVIANYYRNYGGPTEGIYLNGRSDATGTTPTTNMSAPIIRIGRHAVNTNNGMTGDMAEVIVYDANLTAAERSRVQSYLAIKYGITLDQTTATDYVRSDGAVIYSATTFAGYLSDVAGIGRDDDSDLSQSSSKSQNANSVITIFNPSSMNNDFDMLVWGSNNGSLTTPNTSDVQSPIQRRLSRVWRTSEPGGNIGNVSIDVDLNGVPGNITSSDLRLIVDGNGTFNAGNTLYTVSSSPSSRVYRFTGVSLNNGDYFTIGSINASQTPLPIELADFNVVYEDPVVVATWETSSELNNDFFTLERAGIDLAFDEVGRQVGAGTSKIPHTYSMIDSHPYEGPSYYRLKQTDFDGTVSYSDVESIFIKESEKKLIVFPNPNEGRSLRFSFGASRFNLDHVEIYNQHGQSIQHSYLNVTNLREYSLELRHRLAPGLYLLRVHYNGKDEYVKLAVHSKN